MSKISSENASKRASSLKLSMSTLPKTSGRSGFVTMIAYGAALMFGGSAVMGLILKIKDKKAT